MKLLNHENFKISKIFRERLKNSLQTYEGRDLNDIDKKLLKGINEKSIEDQDYNKDKILTHLKKYILKKVYEEATLRRSVQIPQG